MFFPGLGPLGIGRGKTIHCLYLEQVCRRVKKQVENRLSLRALGAPLALPPPLAPLSLVTEPHRDPTLRRSLRAPPPRRRRRRRPAILILPPFLPRPRPTEVGGAGFARFAARDQTPGDGALSSPPPSAGSVSGSFCDSLLSLKAEAKPFTQIAQPALHLATFNIESRDRERQDTSTFLDTRRSAAQSAEAGGEAYTCNQQLLCLNRNRGPDDGWREVIGGNAPRGSRQGSPYLARLFY